MELVELDIEGGWDMAARYDVLDRVKRLADRRQLVFAGFDLSTRARLLIGGPYRTVSRFVSALKSGTAQSSGGTHRLIDERRTPVEDPARTLVALHVDAAEGADPLSTPWSSHRDLLGYREASFFDASWWNGRVDPRGLHLVAGGGPLPSEPTPPHQALDVSLRISAATLGLLPADPRSFRLFSHLARWDGARQIDIADALMLTPRRIRQLQALPEPRLARAAAALADRRLRRVP